VLFTFICLSSQLACENIYDAQTVICVALMPSPNKSYLRCVDTFECSTCVIRSIATDVSQSVCLSRAAKTAARIEVAFGVESWEQNELCVMGSDPPTARGQISERKFCPLSSIETLLCSLFDAACAKLLWPLVQFFSVRDEMCNCSMRQGC